MNATLNLIGTIEKRIHAYETLGKLPIIRIAIEGVNTIRLIKDAVELYRKQQSQINPNDPYYNLMGALVDLKQLYPTATGRLEVCIKTLDRVQAQLATRY